MRIVEDINGFDDVIKRANEITGNQKQDNYTIEEILGLLEDMTVEYGRLEEERETMEENIKDYYTEKSPYSVYGVSPSDFH